MTIRTKLVFNAICLVAINGAIVAAGLTGIDLIRDKVGELTGRSTPNQTRTLELQRSIQEVRLALAAASAARTVAELNAGKAGAAKALAEVRMAEEALESLSAKENKAKISAELAQRAAEIFPPLEASLQAQAESVEAGRLASLRVADSSRLLVDLDSKIRALQLNRMALFMSKLDQTEKIEEVRNSPALTQSSIATNCLLGNAELVRLGTLLEARAEQLLAARSPAEAAAAAQGIREAYSKIDPAVVYLEKMLKKIDAQEELQILGSVRGSLYSVRELLLSETGSYSKIDRSFEMTARAEQGNQRIRDLVGRRADESRDRVSNAHGEQEKTVRSVNDLVRGTTRNVLVLGIVATLVGLAFSLAMVAGIGRSIGDFLALFERFGAGDLTVRMNELRKDEFGRMARHFNIAAGRINGLVHELTGASGSLAGAASQLSETVNGAKADAATISGQIARTAVDATRTNEKVKSAHSLVARANRSMVELSAAIRIMTAQSESAHQLVKTIDEIAFKTNILSLNAAIEAAHAGAAGAGFEVVAREVRNLAGQTSTAARETAERIGEIVERTRKGREAAESTGEAFLEVAAVTREVDSFVETIATSAVEQDERIRKINNRTTELGRIAHENAAAATQLADSMRVFRVE